MKECICGKNAIYLCRPCQAAVCENHKVIHQESNQRVHIYENLRVELSLQERSKIIENLSSKIKIANKSMDKIIKEYSNLIEYITNSRMKALNIIKKKQQYYAYLLKICHKSLFDDQIRELESVSGISLVLNIPAHQFNEEIPLIPVEDSDENRLYDNDIRKEYKLLSGLLKIEIQNIYKRMCSVKDFSSQEALIFIELYKENIKYLPYDKFRKSLIIISRNKKINQKLRVEISDNYLDMKLKTLLAENNIDPLKVRLNVTANLERRLSKELSDQFHEWCMGVRFWHEGILNSVKGLILGPIDSPYEGGIYLLDIDVSEYTYKPPKVRFMTKVYHPNIALDGTFSINILEDEFSPALTIRTILISIQSILCEYNDRCLLNPEAHALLNTNPDEFNRIAGLWRDIYA